MELGTTLAGGYTIEALAGIGGMSTVFRARDSRGHPVAVKVLQLDMSGSEERFQREIRVLAALRHRNIVRYIDSGITAYHQPFLVLEWLDGCDLETLLRNQCLSVDETLVLAERMASALARAHEHKIVHRDVKPGNIVIPHRDLTQTKLIDFGLARWNSGSELLLTRPGDAMGTLAYMSPEQARGDRNIDGAADLFSLGCVLFECLTGRPPFLPRGAMELQFDILFERSPSVREFLPQVPASVDELLLRLLAKDPEERVESSQALLSELLDIRHALADAGPQNIYVRRARRQRITSMEERLVSVVVAIAPHAASVTSTAVHAGQPAVFLHQLPQAYWRGLDGASTERPPGATEIDAAATGQGDVAALSGTVPTDREFPHEGPTDDTMPTMPLSVREDGAAASMPVSQSSISMQQLRDELEPQMAKLGAKLAALRDGSLVAVLDSEWARMPATAVDHAATAVRCGVMLRRALPEGAVAIVTGRAKLERWQLMGEAVDAAIALAMAHQRAWMERGGAEDPKGMGGGGRSPMGIRIDELTARLVASHFAVRTAEPSVHVIDDDAVSIETGGYARTGVEVGFVGRTSELAVLHGAVDECIEDSMARAVVVTGSAGMGKTRLCREFLCQITGQSREFDVWYCHGDPQYTASPLATVADAVRSAIGMMTQVSGLGSAPPRTHLRRRLRAQLRNHVADLMEDDCDIERVSVFLGELLQIGPEDDIGRGLGGQGDEDGEREPVVPAEDQGCFDMRSARAATSVQLAAARANPTLMADQIRRAVLDFIEASLRVRPVIWLIDDAHWCDRSSLSLLDHVLATFHELPCLLVGLARPALHEQMPGLWARRRVVHLRLGGLSRRTAERLIGGELGAQLDESQVEAMIECAQGNPFYLTELVRGASEGDDALPETIMAMVHARLATLEPEARRVLRAASVFGQRFWPRGIAALVGGRISVDAWLEHLVHADLIRRHEYSRLSGDVEYGFQHWLIRDGAYDTLTGQDRELAHRLAGEWLQRMGESDAGVIADHFFAGKAPDLALPHYVRAAEAALSRGDLDAADIAARRGLHCGAEGHGRGRLLWIQGQERIWRGSVEEVVTLCEEAMLLLPAGTRTWYDVMGESYLAWAKIGRIEDLARARTELARPTTTDEERGGRLLALAKLAQARCMVGLSQQAHMLLEEIECELADHGDIDAQTKANIHLTRVVFADFVSGDKEVMVAEITHCITNFMRIGDRRQVCLNQSNLGYAMVELGRFEDAERVLSSALADADRMGIGAIIHCIQHNLASVLAYRGQMPQACEMIQHAIDWFSAASDQRMTAGSLLDYARMLLMQGAFDQAEAQIEEAGQKGALSGLLQPRALALSAGIALGRGLNKTGLALSQKAMALLLQASVVEGNIEFSIRLTYIDALIAVGEMDAARAAAMEAKALLLTRADKIQHAAWRHTFLYQIPDHARILQHAEHEHEQRATCL